MDKTVVSIIGLEVHVELTTVSKMFCSCSADHFGKEPNSQTCPVCLGLPGALPVPNQKAIEDTLKLGLALNCHVNLKSHFDRKQYFYPDLPKGYQISQYQHPFCSEGYLNLDSGKKIRIERVHLEEDTGKLQHANQSDHKISLVDFNRSGVPLVEIVSYPDMRSADEAKEYLKKIHQIIKSLGISTANMEQGQMRLEPTVNVEITDKTGRYFTPLAEVKNINSFNFAATAINYEINRQVEQFLQDKKEKNNNNKQTRGFDNNRKVTFVQRQKEEAKDYRYFPEPDIPPFIFTSDLVKRLKNNLPQLPDAEITELIALGVNQKFAQTLISKPKELTLFRQFYLDPDIDSNKLANFLVNKKIIPDQPIKNQYLNLINQGSQDEDELNRLINQVIKNNAKAVDDYRQGKTGVLGFLVGQVIKLSQSKADPQTVSRLLLEKLGSGQ